MTSDKPKKSSRPYYGKATYRTVVVKPATSGTSKHEGAWLWGLIGAFTGGKFGGWLGAIVGGVIGAKFGYKIRQNTEGTPAVTKQVEITSPCIKCGSIGQVTAQVDGKTGFQCKACRNSWTVGKSVCLICGKKGSRHDNHWHCSDCNNNW